MWSDTFPPPSLCSALHELPVVAMGQQLRRAEAMRCEIHVLHAEILLAATPSKPQVRAKEF